MSPRFPRPNPALVSGLAALVVWGLVAVASSAETEDGVARGLLADLVLAESEEEQASALEGLADEGHAIIRTVAEAWRIGEVFTVPGAEPPVALIKTPEGYFDIRTGIAHQPTATPQVSRASRDLRRTLKEIVDLLDLLAPDPAARIATAERMGLSRDASFIPILRDRLTRQDDPRVRAAFETSIEMLMLIGGTDAERAAAVKSLGERKAFQARDLIVEFRTAAMATGGEAGGSMVNVADEALEKIDAHLRRVEIVGTVFRGLSLGSVLLLVAYGLAITFGLMGVINMAHGEFIAIGGYVVYLVQGYFATRFGAGTAAYETYFLWALPASFLAAGVMGVALERGIVQFLYRRPLESLLATWGVSMVLQQLFRLRFGAANVAVSSPQWLSGSHEIAGVTMSYNRIFVIGFALLVVLVTWLLLARTNWGLHVRATMQNRTMAACLGVRSGRVNMVTFAFGSGLAGLAGAFLSQIGNVGPSMGQAYIVDSFMVVVIGGVGNLMGTALSALGIGMVDQSLQPILGPVMGKITVLFAIILFLQFKPGGLFPARSRSLDD